MADIPIKKSRGKKYIGGASPIVPSYVVGDAPPPNNPPGSGGIGDFVTLDTDQTITGQKTFDARVRITDNEISINNWVTSSGSYDKLSIDFGESRGVGYDPYQNEIFVKGTTNVPFKIDTDAPSDSLQILASGGLKASNIPSGTPVSNLGLDVDNNLVKDAALVQTAGTFTASLEDSGGSRTYSAVTQNSFYIKTGRFVYVSIYFGSVFSGGGTPTGVFQITGLPYPCSADVTVNLEGVMTRVTGTSPALDPKDINPTLIGGSSLIRLRGNSPPTITSGQIALVFSYLTD